ncbi:MAG: N-acetyltransferase family protein [Gammaproteobacteria bacterium]|nr:N-acetyltransferase family protein [Gammaproteobacteria bacterium]
MEPGRDPASGAIIRPALMDDLPGIIAIYNHYVRHTAMTFDLEPTSVEARREWLAGFDAEGRHQLLVLVEDAGGNETITGYAYSGPMRPRAAYDRSVETSIYLHPDAGGRGLGTRLYTGLLDRLAATDVHRCYGVITVPNPGSIRLHEKLGFVEVGRLTECGRKFDRWWDVVWMERGMEA